MDPVENTVIDVKDVAVVEDVQETEESISVPVEEFAPVEDVQLEEKLSPAAETVKGLQQLTDFGIPPADKLVAALNNLSDAVKAGGPVTRTECLELGAYLTVCKAWYLICHAGENSVILFGTDATEVRDATIDALYSLTAAFPDIIDETGWTIIQQSIDLRMPYTTLTLGMKLIRNICIKSEANREKISWELDLMEPLVLLIKRDQPSHEFVREWCGAMKALILSDDIRVSYNRAPERKRMIFQKETLPLLTSHLHTFEGDEVTTNAIVVLLGSMAGTDSMCISIESGNVFPAIQRIFRNFSQNKMLIKNTISLLRYLNVSQTIREKCTAYGLVKWVLQYMMQYKNLEEFLEIGLSCLAFMTLRNACQTAQLISANGVPIVLEIVERSMDKVQLLKGSCLTLRNVAANGGDIAKSSILENQGEASLRQIEEKFPDLRENYVKPALRDLGVLKDEELSPNEEQKSKGSTLIKTSLSNPPNEKMGSSSVKK